MQRVTKIFGPPGTGKTTKLLSIVEDALARGIAPEQIAYVSFSRKAAEEAVNRASHKFNIQKEKFRYFRTLHSLGYYVQGLNIDDGMQYDDYLEIAETLSLEITKFNDEEDNTYGNKDGDNCMQIHRLSRSRMIEAHDEWRNAEKQVSIRWPIVEQWIETVNQYKKDHNKHDYEDMLENYSGTIPVKIFIVDEAQDLSKLQWWVVSQASKSAEDIYLAGDDDQSVYNWNGADVDSFLNFPAIEEIVLPKSWRVPEQILFLADRIAKRIQHRKRKVWEPVGKGGAIISDLSLWDLPLEQDDWFILVRNTKFLKEVELVLKEKGLLFNNNKYKSRRSIRIEDARLIMNWEALRRGESITMAAAGELTKKLSDRLPLPRSKTVSMADMPFTDEFKAKPWYEVMNKALHPRQVEYIRSCLRNNQKLTDEPKITISTIHKVKGGEATNVAILPDYSYLSAQYIDSDDEHRIQYVAVTRAKQNLYLLSPETEYFYEY